jgi:hypothetical protein
MGETQSIGNSKYKNLKLRKERKAEQFEELLLRVTCKASL